LTSTAATLNGTLSPNGSDTSYYFEYGTSTNYGVTTPSVDAGTGSSAQAVSVTLTALSPSTTYHFQLVATNANGTTDGGDLNFVTEAPAASYVTTVSGTPQSATVGTAFQALVAGVWNASANSNVSVTFSAPNSGAGGTFESGSSTASVLVTTNSNGDGTATAPTFTANSTAGSYTVTASIQGGAQAGYFSLTNEAGSPFNIARGKGYDQTAVTGEAFIIPLAVTVTDQHGNPVSGISVVFQAPTSGASGDFAATGGPSTTVTTDSDGNAVASTFTANSIAGGYVVDAKVSGASPVAFPLVNELSSPTTPVNSSCTDGIGNDAFLCAAYGDLLGRTPDSSDLAYWDTQLANGASRSAVAYDIVTSAEYRNDLISGYYQAFLGRGVDAAGLWYWMTQLNAGASDQSVIAGILGSGEFYTDSGGTPDGLITALYTKLLGRAPDVGGLAFWEGQLSSGTTPSTVAAGVLSSAEYETEYVEALYSHLLGRTTDAVGLSYWVGQLAGGVPNEFVISALVGSAEFYADATA
jgi:hypothetical protein